MLDLRLNFFAYLLSRVTNTFVSHEFIIPKSIRLMQINGNQLKSILIKRSASPDGGGDESGSCTDVDNCCGGGIGGGGVGRLRFFFFS